MIFGIFRGFLVSKKIIAFSLCAASALLSACSDDSPASPVQDPSVIVPENPGTTIAPITGEIIPTDPGIPQDPTNPGYTDPTNPQVPGNTDPANPTDPSQPQNPISSSSIVQPAVSSSSATAPSQSSSSGLKDYDDNHLPKESFLPPAGFYSSLTIHPPTPQKGGQIKCTFDGSFPTQGSQAITAAKQITENTVIRCSEFVNGQPADTTTQTYFINENVSMPVVALTVNHYDMFDSTAGLYATMPKRK